MDFFSDVGRKIFSSERGDEMCHFLRERGKMCSIIVIRKRILDQPMSNSGISTDPLDDSGKLP